MIEYLFPPTELHKVKPPRMEIGDFFAFKKYNPLGKGQQAVHNSGSSMLKDTPSFKKKVLSFINEHFKYSDEYYESEDINKFISYQVESLLKFKQNIYYRSKCLEEIFDNIDDLNFSNNIKTDYLYISLVLFFVKEYNFFKSNHADHAFTKKKAAEYYKSENKFIRRFVEQLKIQQSIKYISDICFGRYYFLEVHFQEKINPRNVPLSIVKEFLFTQKKHLEDYDLIEQKEIQSVKPLTSNELEKFNNRNPELVRTSGRKSYKTNFRLAKTVLFKIDYKCELNSSHVTFTTKYESQFSESHHLIPMSFQDKYLPINIDREENITSLCPTCHRAIHLGNEKEKKTRLNILFNKKKTKLKECGLDISFEKLISLYL